MFGLGLLQHPRDLAKLMHEKPCLISKVTMCSTLKFRFSFRSSGLRLSVRSLDSISVAGFLSTFSTVASLLHQPTALSSTLTLLYAVIYLQGVSLLRVCTKLCISDGQVIFPGTCVFFFAHFCFRNESFNIRGGAGTFRRGRKIFGRLLGVGSK